MTEYIKADDIHAINKALSSGFDVRIQRTKNGVRVIEDKITVILKREVPDKSRE